MLAPDTHNFAELFVYACMLGVGRSGKTTGCFIKDKYNQEMYMATSQGWSGQQIDSSKAWNQAETKRNTWKTSIHLCLTGQWKVQQY